MTIEKFEGFAIHADHVETCETGGVLSFATFPRAAWESTDVGKRWLDAKAAMSGTGVNRLVPGGRTALPCGGSALANVEGVPTLVKLPADGTALPADLESDLTDMGWLVKLGDWIPAGDGGDQAPVVEAERLGPKPDDAAIDATIRAAAAELVSWEPDPTRRDGETFDRTQIGDVRIMLHTTTTVGGSTRYYLIGYRETWSPTREVKMTIMCAGRPSGSTVRALAQLVEAAFEAMGEHFPSGRA